MPGVGLAIRPSFFSKNTNAATAPATATATNAVRIGPLPFFLRRGSFRGRSISRNGAASDLLSMKIVKRRGKQGGRHYVKSHDIDVRVRFSQSQHRQSLPRVLGLASFSPRASLSARNLRASPDAPVVYFMRSFEGGITFCPVNDPDVICN
jgi:hypothetical protein